MCLNPIRVKKPRRSTRPYDGMDVPESSKMLLARALSLIDAHACPDGYMYVPCGRCCECLRKRRNEWRTRLIHETQFGNYRRVLFVTLTISPQHYGKYSKDPAKAVRRFCDLVRKTYHRSMRYFFVTELGEDNSRLHFHGIIWDPPFLRGRDFRRNPSYKVINRRLRHFWKIGMTWVGWCDARTCSYVVKYITKPDELHPDYRPRVFCSPGIGGCYLKPSVVQGIRNRRGRRCSVDCNGRQTALPRYYLTKCFSPVELRLYSVCHRILYPVNPLFFQGVQYSSMEALDCVRSRLLQESVARGTSRPPLRSRNHESASFAAGSDLDL